MLGQQADFSIKRLAGQAGPDADNLGKQLAGPSGSSDQLTLDRHTVEQGFVPLNLHLLDLERAGSG
jgi:hypothetical protein